MANLSLPSSTRSHSTGSRHSMGRNPFGTLFNTFTHRHKHLKLQNTDGKENKAGLGKQSKSSVVLPLTSSIVQVDKSFLSAKVAQAIGKEGAGEQSSISSTRGPQSATDSPSSKGASSGSSTESEESTSQFVQQNSIKENKVRVEDEVSKGISSLDEDNMIESRKHFLAPSNPPPPVPQQKFGSPLKVINGGMNLSTTSNVNGNGVDVDKADSLKTEKLSSDSESPPKSQNGSVNIGGDSSRNVRDVQLNGHVGFDSLPHQLVRKSTEQGFQFNLMCVGETGMGKSTLIESLFNMKLEFPPCNNELKTVELHSKTYDVTEGGIHLKLTIVETAGFGDQLDKDKSAEVIVNYINDQFEKYLKEELKIKRCLEYYDDTRIHACLYFISPTGHGLKALDVVTMRRLSERVNVIPIIAKADTACKDELVRFKSKILSELQSYNIPIYQFPTDDEIVRKINTELNQLIPYAVVGSTDFVKKENGKLVRARRYPWGIVEVENEEHCDFVKLREAVLRTNVDALRERTHRVLYEDYRRERLRAMKVGDGDTGPKMVEAFAQKKKEFDDEMAQKEKLMREEFIARVNRKEEEMKKKEELLNMRAKEIKELFDDEMKKIETVMNNLLEEKIKIEAKMGKKQRK